MLAFSPKSVTKDFLTDLPERSRKVLTYRFGLAGTGERRTLDSIGKEYGITRERIRQIESHGIVSIRDSEYYKKHTESIEDLKRSVHELGSVIAEHVLLEKVPKSPSDRNHVAFLLNVGHHFTYKRENDDFHARWHVDATLSGAIERALMKLYKEVDADKLIPEDEFLKMFKDFLREEGVTSAPDHHVPHWLSISKRVAKNPLGEWGRVESPHVRIRNTRDFAYLTLKRHGSPMHFTEVARGITKLFGRETHPATTHNELIKDKRFVLVGRGLYALKEWGYAPGVVRDVIHGILTREGPLTRSEIIERVKRERYVKDATVLVNLQSGAFSRLDDGRYSVLDK
jgi:hypothetical protein